MAIKYAFTSRRENDPRQSMADWESEKKLNDVLRYLSNFYYRNVGDEGYDSGFVPYPQFEKYMDTRSVYNSECLSLVLYLSRDNKIDIYPSEDVILKAGMKTPEKLRLNFEGFMFHNNWGYVRQKKDRDNERRIDFLETWAIILGGVFAVLYYLDQLTGVVHGTFHLIGSLFSCECQ